MHKRLLSGALGTVLIAGSCAEASALATSTGRLTSAASTRQRGASVHKFQEGGIQFTVPAGWEVKAEEDAVKIFPKSHGAQIAFVALPIPTDLNSDQKAGLFDSLSEKAGISDMKLDKYLGNEMLGGMKAALRFYEGKNNGHDVAGMFLLLNADKFVFIVLVGAKSEAATYEELEAVINSIKKIE